MLRPACPAVQRGKGVLYQVLGRPQGHTIQAVPALVRAGRTFEDDMIAHPGEEFAYVLFGEIELLFGDEVHRLSQGDLVALQNRDAARLPQCLPSRDGGCARRRRRHRGKQTLRERRIQ